MKLGHVSRNYAKAFFAFAALALVGACAEKSTVAPGEQAARVIAPANFITIGAPVTFRVNNAEGITKKIDNHVINIPAGAICELGSGYGSTEWDNPCTPMLGSVVITAIVLQDSDGRPYIDFQPAMRFSPTKEVMLFFYTGFMSDNTIPVVKYCNTLAYCYDESLSDPSVKPFRIGNSPILGRRLKHFSGYMIGAGEACAVSLLGGSCEAEGLLRRSGYMVASGEDIVEMMGKTSDKKDEQ